eukprot:68293-Lingulodinium_polyedra.AAC.1
MAAGGGAGPAPGLAEPWVFVLYAVEGQPLWHQRLRLGSLAGSSGGRDFVASPDGDVYEESLHLPDPD